MRPGALFYEWRRDRRLARLATLPVAELWNELVELWSRADEVYRGPIGFGCLTPLEYGALALLLKREEAEFLLSTKGLAHPRAKVVAYALVGLDTLDALVLRDLPPSLLARQEPIVHQLACRACRQSLGEFADMTRHWALDRAEPPRTTSGSHSPGSS